MSQKVVVFFNKDVIIIKPLMIALLLMKIAFLGGAGGGGAVEGAPWVLATSPATNNKQPATWNLTDNPAMLVLFEL